MELLKFGIALELPGLAFKKSFILHGYQSDMKIGFLFIYLFIYLFFIVALFFGIIVSINYLSLSFSDVDIKIQVSSMNSAHRFAFRNSFLEYALVLPMWCGTRSMC